MTRQVVLAVPLLAACGSVSAQSDAHIGDSQGPTDAKIDGTTDAPIDAAPMLPTPKMRWTFENNLNNTGTATATLTSLGGNSYVAGKVGQAISFGNNQVAAVTSMRATFGTYGKVTVAYWLKEPGNLQVANWDCNNRTTSPYGGVQIGFNGPLANVCVSTTSNAFLGGSPCPSFTAPSSNEWHHWIIRYNGTGIGTGQGGPTEIYIDGALVKTIANDTSNNPVWTANIPDTLYAGGPGTQLDEFQVWDQVFTVAEQCSLIVGGTYANGICTPP
jgi:hypothetical protein